MPLLPGCSRFQYASSTLASCALHGRCSSRAQASLQASASPSSSPRLRIHDTSKMSALLCRPSPSPRHLALPALLVLALRGNPFAQAPVPFGRSRAPGATHVHRPPRRPRLRVISSVSLALRFGFLVLPALRPVRASLRALAFDPFLLLRALLLRVLRGLFVLRSLRALMDVASLCSFLSRHSSRRQEE